MLAIWLPMEGSADAATAACFLQGILGIPRRPLMAGMRNDRTRARARDLLATVYPIPDNVEFQRLRELAVDYIQEAERLEAEQRGRGAETDELISAALDAVARDYFTRSLLRTMPHRKR
jgi:hypothetical protein